MTANLQHDPRRAAAARSAAPVADQPLGWRNPKVPVLTFTLATGTLAPTYAHVHTGEYELHFIRRGGRLFMLDRRRVPFHGYMALVIRPGQVHRRFHDGRWLNETGLIFGSQILADRLGGAAVGRLPPWIHLDSLELSVIEMHCREIGRELEEMSPASAVMIKNELENIVFLLQRASQRKTPEPVEDARVSAVIAHIEENFAAGLDINRLASIASMSPGHLSHLFKRQTGMGIKHYILQCRIAAAKCSLESPGDDKIATLAARLGFSDSSLFERCFRRFAGVSPGAYRRISRKNRRIC